jgi:CubicO group peptidase (beta-lactamase class C family)
MILAIVAVWTYSHADQGGFALASRIDAFVRTEMVKDHIPGLSVAVVKGGKSVFERGYGSANIELSAPATADSVYELQSVTKQFTATAIMLLVADGKIKLDRPVSEYLPDLPSAWSGITIRHLLTHTSGVADYTEAPGWGASIRQDRTPEELLMPVKKMPLLFVPGSQWRYSNSNYYLLGQVIERLSGRTWADFLAARIFRPLGMTASRANELTVIVPKRASGYHWSKGGLINVPPISPSQKWAAGGVISSVKDLIIWDGALSSGKLLSRDSLAMMLTPAKLTTGTDAPYGFGNELEQDHGHRVAGHQGSGLGFNTTFLRFVDDKVTVIVLDNVTQGRSRQIARTIASFLIPGLSDSGNSGIVDDDPPLTARLKLILVEAGAGKADPSNFALSATQQLIPIIKRSGQQMLGTLGTLKSLTLLESTAKPTGSTRRYRAVYDSKALIWTFQLDQNGHVIDMEPQME